jgi:hypothetical protein
MKKLNFICCLLCFSLFSFTSFSQPRKNKNSVFVEFNFLANNLSLKYNRLLMLGDKSALGYSIGLNSMYKRTGFIIPPNIGFPIDINYLYGTNLSYVFIGVNATPQFIFSKIICNFFCDFSGFVVKFVNQTFHTIISHCNSSSRESIGFYNICTCL